MLAEPRVTALDALLRQIYSLYTGNRPDPLSLDIFIGPGARSGTNPAAKCEQEGYSESQAESAPDTNAGTGTKTLTRERTFT